MADNARDELAATLKSILDTGKYSDFIITCQGDTYNVHKAVVCARSSFFDAADKFPGKESEEGKVDLPEDEPAVIKLLVQYLYGGEYDPKLPDGGCMESNPKIEYTGYCASSYCYEFPHTCSYSNCSIYLCPHHYCGSHGYSKPCKEFICDACCPNATPASLPPAVGKADQLLLHAKMYEVADKYDVIGLKKIAREKFLRAAAHYWNSERFAPAAHYAFSTTPEEDKGLRDVVSNIVSKHMELLNKPAVEALLTEFNGLAVGLLKMRAKELGWTKAA